MPAINANWRTLVNEAATGGLGALRQMLTDVGGLFDNLTPGTAAASKAVVLDSNKAISGLRDTVTAGSTSTTIANSGITTLSSTTSGTKAHTMAAPVAGVRAVLACTAGSTVNLVSVTLASGTFDGTNAVATFNAAGDTLSLVGLSSTAYQITANVGSVALSTA